MRMPALLCRVPPFPLPFRAGSSGADAGFIPTVLVLLVMGVSTGVSGVTERRLPAAPAEPGAAPVEAAGNEDQADGEAEDAGLPLAVDRRVPLDMTKGAGSRWT